MRFGDVLAGGFKGLVVLRALYAVLLCAGTISYRLGLGAPFPIEENIAVVLMTMPAWYFSIWAVFVTFYAAAALLLLLRSSLTLPVYAAAFATDFLLSLYWFQQPAMERAYSGNANLVEWSLNAIDLTVIAILLLTGRFLTGPAVRR